MQITTKIFLEKLFPQDDCYWRVDWVDGLINKLQEREPQLRVFLTKIKSGLKGAINPISPYSIDKSAKSHATIIIGVGHQNIVYIGSVWHQGRVCIIRKKATHYHLKKAGYNHSKRPHIIIQSSH